MLNIRRRGNPRGPLVIFLHAVGISSWMWEPVVERLPEVDALLVDLPGHGGSRDQEWISLDASAQAVAEVTTSLVHKRDVHLVGLSLGAYVGLILLCRQPDAYRTAVLSGLHIGGMPNPRMMKLMSWLMAPLVTRPMFARKTAAAMRVPASDVERFVGEAGLTAPTSFRKASIDAVNFAAPAELESVQTRALFAAGAREHPLIRHSLIEFCHRVPNADSLIVPDAGHGWSGEKPQLFADTVRKMIFGPAS